MPFIVEGLDYADALPRRMENRAAHLDRLKKSGKGLYAAALLDDKGDMRGSMLVLDFATRAEIDAFLADEPYITGKVWEKVTIRPCKPAVLAG